MSSKFEAFGRTTVEAMLSGCLLAGAATGGTVELLDGGNCGILYENGKSEFLQEQLEKIFSDTEKMKKIAERGQKYAVEHFDAELNAKNVYEIYKELE